MCRARYSHQLARSSAVRPAPAASAQQKTPISLPATAASPAARPSLTVRCRNSAVDGPGSAATARQASRNAGSTVSTCRKISPIRRLDPPPATARKAFSGWRALSGDGGSYKGWRWRSSEPSAGHARRQRQLTARASEPLGQAQFQPGRTGQGGVEICGSGAVARPGRPGRIEEMRPGSACLCRYKRSIPGGTAMNSPDMPRHIEVGDGGQPVAAAEVTTADGADGTVRASLHASAGHLTPGSRASLVDAVMDLPEVQASTRLEATIPLGDGESLERLRERTEDAVTRSAGSTTLLDANIPSGSQPEPGQDPDDGT